MSFPLDIRTITRMSWAYLKRVSNRYGAEHESLGRSQSPIHLDGLYSTAYYYRVIPGRAAELLEVLLACKVSLQKES